MFDANVTILYSVPNAKSASYILISRSVMSNCELTRDNFIRKGRKKKEKRRNNNSVTQYHLNTHVNISISTES